MHYKVQKDLKNAYLNLFNDLWLLGASSSKRSHLLFSPRYLTTMDVLFAFQEVLNVSGNEIFA